MMVSVGTREQQSGHHSRKFICSSPSRPQKMGRLSMAPETEQNKFPPNLSGGIVIVQFFPNLYPPPPLAQKMSKTDEFIDSSLYLVLKATVALHQWHEKRFHRLSRIRVVRLMLAVRTIPGTNVMRTTCATNAFIHTALLYFFDSLPHLHILPTLPFPSLLLVERYQ